ncbi:hypothetical protein Ciccas_001888 [Cichlidogyrus casuarinus]|uniref:INTS8 TPR repeats domain-containing protein n=1 Tax=Cichlidogyrus casuarinus TaxID=1844966 RepID=A0ABD2QIR9_9PLAT
MIADSSLLLPLTGEVSNISLEGIQWNLPIWSIALPQTVNPTLSAPIAFVRGHIQAIRVAHQLASRETPHSMGPEMLALLRSLRDAWIAYFCAFVTSSEAAPSDPNSWTNLRAETMFSLVQLLLSHKSLPTDGSIEAQNVVAMILFMAHGALSSLYPTRMFYPATLILDPRQRCHDGSDVRIPDSEGPQSPDAGDRAPSPPQLTDQSRLTPDLVADFQFFRCSINVCFLFSHLILFSFQKTFKGMDDKLFGKELWTCGSFPDCLKGKLNVLGRHLVKPLLCMAVECSCLRPDWRASLLELHLAECQNGPMSQENCAPELVDCVSFALDKRCLFNPSRLNPHAVLSQFLEIFSVSSANFAHPVPDEFLSDRVISVMVYCCQLLGLVGQALVLCQFASKEQLVPVAIELCRGGNSPGKLADFGRIPTSSRELLELNQKALQGTANGAADDRTLTTGLIAYERWIDYLYNLNILEELVAIETQRGATHKRDLLIC